MKTIDNRIQIIANYMVCFLIISYILPAGMMGEAHIQRWIIYILLPICLWVAIQNEKLIKLLKNYVVEVIVIIIGSVWCIISYWQGSSYSFQFFSLLYITLFTFLGLSILLKYDVINLDIVIKCILFMLFGKIVEKMIVEILFILQLIEYDQVTLLYQNLFHADVTTMTMQLSNVELVRIQTSSDAIVFSLAPFLWFVPEIKRKYRISLFFLTGIFSLIVFSRLYLAQFAFFAVISLIYYGRKLRKKAKIVFGAGIVIAAVFCIRPVVDIIRIRFFSSSVSESDSIRVEQLNQFVEVIPDHLWLGRGMGSYLPNYLRDFENPFSYELEYLSYIYQLGILGFVLIIGGMIYIYLHHIYTYFRETELWVRFLTIMVVLWYLIRPVFNPSFLGKQNGFLIMGVLLINAYFWKKRYSDL